MRYSENKLTPGCFGGSVLLYVVYVADSVGRLLSERHSRRFVVSMAHGRIAAVGPVVHDICQPVIDTLATPVGERIDTELATDPFIYSAVVVQCAPSLVLWQRRL